MKRFLITTMLAVMLAAQPAFCSNADEYGYTVENGTVISYVGMEKDIIVPAESDGKKVTKIGDKAFAGQVLDSAATESGITEIGAEAFRGSTLVRADICDTMESIGDRAFADCAGLLEVYLINFDTQFGKDAFKNTNYIIFCVDCQISFSEEQRLLDRIYDAKGDENFAIEKLHSYVEDEATGMLKCEWCGDEFYTDGPVIDGPETWYEGPIGEGGLLDDGKWGDPTFVDVAKDTWYFDYVETAVEQGILNGKGDGIFAPDDNVTIAETIKIAACAHAELTGRTIAESGGENWYDKYVDYAKTSGIIENGVDFNYSDPATRAEIAYLFARADVDAVYINPDVPLNDIPDVDASTPYSQEILKMYRLGAAVGSDDMLTFHPYDNVKRSEAAAMIVRIMNNEYRVDLPKG